MNEIQELLALLKEKRECLLKFEIEADSICNVPMEEIELHMEHRQDLIDKMKIIDEEVELHCQKAGKEVDDALHNRCGRGGLSDNLGQLFDAAIQVKSVLNRILVIEPLVGERIEQERRLLLEKIEAVNTGSLAAAKKYNPSMNTNSNMPYFPPDVRKI